MQSTPGTATSATTQARWATQRSRALAPPWSSSTDLNVGVSGSGTLSINAGGTVNDSSGYLGIYSGAAGTATISGAGSTWTNSATLYVGFSGSGTVNVTNAGALSTYEGQIGYNSNSMGTVTIQENGSTWTNTGDLIVGGFGTGTLNINSGGAATVSGTTYVACDAGSTGAIAFGSGTLTTGALAASPSQLTGTSTIDARGLISDLDLLFDSTASLNQTFRLNNQSGQDIVLNLDMATEPSSNVALGAGWRGSGSLTIRSGTTVNSQSGYIGYCSGSTGVATVTGTGSMWTTGPLTSAIMAAGR